MSGKQKVIHTKKFMQGRMTPKEAHQALGWNGRRCDGCATGVAAIRCLSFAPAEEVSARAPELLIKLAHQNGGKVPMVQFTYGHFVRIGDSYACTQCRKDLEKAAAKGPSWVLVEFQTGPAETKAQVQVQ